MARAFSTSSVSRRLLLAYTVFIVYGCTIPFRFTADRAALADKWARVGWNPLRTEGGRLFHIPDAIQNVALFIPFGAAATFAFSRRVPSMPARIAAVAASAVAVSVAVETIQLFTVDRDVTMTDVVTDTIGGVAGAAVARLFRPIGARALRRLARAGVVDRLAFYPCAVAAAIVLVAAWQPFDVTLDVSTFLDKIHSLRQDIWQYGAERDEGVAIIHAALLALAASAWLDALGVKRPAKVIIPAGLIFSLALELSQLFVASRWPGLWDALVRGAGFAAGSLLWGARRRLTAARWLFVLVLATEAAAAVQMLSPFVVARVAQPFQWLPLMAYSRMTAFEIVGHVIEVCLVFFPVGFVTGLISHDDRRAAGTAAVVCLAMAMPLEYAQGWIVGHFPDVTDIAVATVSGAAGAWAGRGTDAFARAAATLKQW
jgi:VanZ family protein